MYSVVVESEEGDKVILSKKHLKVIRLGVGDVVRCIFKDGRIGIAKVISDDGIAEVVKFIEPWKGVEIKVLLPLMKKGSTDEVISFLCSIGVSEIYPVLMKRGDVRPTPEKAQRMKLRWERISLEEAKISLVSPTKIHSIKDLKEHLLNIQAERKIVFWEMGEKTWGAVWGAGKKVSSIAVALGPEGGIDGGEIRLFENHGFEVVKLGERILPSKFFPIYIVSAIDFIMNFLS